MKIFGRLLQRRCSEMKWTEEQQKVISLRDRNILVSAAAGSGKTAVLVQRILGRIMDSTHPVDIDKMLIMTFTRAAAGEMRERISRALEQALYENPDNDHLQRQMTLIHTAQITTIDGFCAYVIRNYFHLIGLDPGYRTADEGELKLLREDVLKELLEEKYGEEDCKRFVDFVECYASGKTDDGIKELIWEVYQAAMSHPYPEEWLTECLKCYQGEEPVKDAKWMKLLWEACREELDSMQNLAEEAKAICLEEGGPYLYEEALDQDLLLIGKLRELAEREDYDGAFMFLNDAVFIPFSRKKQDVEESLKKQVQDLRKEVKEAWKKLSERYFSCKEETLSALLKNCGESLETLVELTIAFKERFGEKKREKNVLDFTDMEHFALQILVEKDGDTVTMTQAARELSEKYEEVLVDEYQDSNLVQELLTNCVSGWANDRKNIFMVGDVKQSIYRFRLARPELFMEKYKSYTLTDSREQRIDLHKNFRSRREVLQSVNYIFRQIMGEDLGGIAYDDAAALYPGAAFPEGYEEEFVKTEVLLIEKDGEELLEEHSGQNSQELEALSIAQEIRRMVGKEHVLDRETGKYRPVEYGDIAILLRTASGWAETFGEVLASQGIPAYTASKTGYFSALEVVTVLNFLRIADNPLQDIPLMGVLRSPIVNCTSQEAAEIRCACPGGMLYDSICAYVEDGQMELWADEGKEVLKEKLRAFLELLDEIRDMAAYTPIHQLILYVLKATGYGDYARALPGGEQRNANLQMLVEKAMDYEKTSYRGLFNFIRYIESLQKYEVDFGEVNLSGSGASSVQIMTIHKSKGLEFPIVFAAGMGKQFNFRDMNARLLIHPEMGFGADAIFPEQRMVVPTAFKQVIRRELQKESLGEELRVLYVALTRAKEKLVLTGTVGKLEGRVNALSRSRDREEVLLSAGSRMKAKTYWDYVLPALARNRCMDGLYQEYGIAPCRGHLLYGEEAEFTVRKITALDLAGEEVVHEAENQMRMEYLKEWDAGKVYDEEARNRIEERFGYQYPYEYLKAIPVKVSVSELKKRSYAGEYDREESLFFEPDIVPLVPRFAAETEDEYTGAARGTAYHRVMECLDYTRVASAEEIQEQVDGLLRQQKIEAGEAACIENGDVLRFIKSPLGKRMQTAALAGKLYREQPFVISVGASALNEKWPDNERVLVQGIIDAYFLEGEEIVLVDYKTDRVRKGEEGKLVERYRVQLEDYAGALERMLGKKVREKYIYSFAVHEAILV